MKILTNKKYGELFDEIKKEHDKEIKKLSDYSYELLEDKEKYYNLYKTQKEANKEHQILNGMLRKENDELKVQIKKVNGQKGMLTRKINQLTKIIENNNEK